MLFLIKYEQIKMLHSKTDMNFVVANRNADVDHTVITFSDLRSIFVGFCHCIAAWILDNIFSNFEFKTLPLLL